MKKAITSIMALVLAVACICPAFALEEDRAAPTTRCSQCGGLTTYHYSESLIDEQLVQCVHGKSGHDLIELYNVVSYYKCGSCGYQNDYFNGQKQVLIECRGK